MSNNQIINENQVNNKITKITGDFMKEYVKNPDIINLENEKN